jgi:integrase
MSIFKRKGSSYYQYDFIFRGRRCWGSTKLTNRTAAERYENKLRDKLAQSRAGILDPDPPPIFSAYADDFIVRAKSGLRPKSSLRYEVSIKTLKERLGGKRLDEITANDIEIFEELRLNQGKSPSTINRDMACLRRIFSFAIQTDVLVSPPFVARKVRFLKERNRERILTFEEERRYLAKANLTLRDAATLIKMGLRSNEVCSIRRHDVHLLASPSFLHVPGGKTKNARRDVVVTQRCSGKLKRRTTIAKGEYIFPRHVGRGVDWSRPMSELHPAHYDALSDSGVNPRFQLYDLRHTYGTRAIESGTDPLTLMRLMGHADLKTTMRYIHLSKRHLAEAQTKIERYRAEREIAEVEARNNSSATVQ